MNTHKNAPLKNAPLTPKRREAMVRSVIEGALSKAAAARQFNTTPKAAAKWIERFRAEGMGWVAGSLLQGSFIAKPQRLPHARWSRRCATSATRASQSRTRRVACHVSRILHRLGLSRIRDVEPAEPGAPL
jgi:transposase-like protein